MNKALTIKEKFLYLMKISKRRTGTQALVVMAAMLAVIGVNYLFL